MALRQGHEAEPRGLGASANRLLRIDSNASLGSSLRVRPQVHWPSRRRGRFCFSLLIQHPDFRVVLIDSFALSGKD
jgi:hypothetical protein